MNSFRNQRLRNHALPMSTAWLFNDIAEAKGRQELFTRQSPQVLKALREAAIIQSSESSNRIEGVTVAPDRLRPLVLGNTKPRDRSEQEVQSYECLNRSSQRWHEGKHELTPWMNFLLAIIRRGYTEFEKRAGQVKAPRGAKTALVEAAIGAQPMMARSTVPILRLRDDLPSGLNFVSLLVMVHASFLRNQRNVAGSNPVSRTIPVL